MDILKTSRRVRLAILAATTLTLFQLVFAPTDAGCTSPPQFALQPSYTNAMLPSFDEPWDTPALSPAPEQPMTPAPGSMFVPESPVGLIEPGSHPPISPSSPTLIAPDSMGVPDGGFDGLIR